MPSRLRTTAWIAMSLVCVGVLVQGYYHLELAFRVLLAREQVQIFAAMCNEARKGDALQAIGCLEYAVNYYPSGTKQVVNSPLDEIVETSRKLAITDILTTLRQKSKKDFGNDPQHWLDNRKVLEQQRNDAPPSTGNAKLPRQ